MLKSPYASGVDTPPEAAACTTCHDGLMAQIHAMLNGDNDSGVETCALCHGEGTAFDVEAVHAF